MDRAEELEGGDVVEGILFLVLDQKPKSLSSVIDEELSQHLASMRGIVRRE